MKKQKTVNKKTSSLKELLRVYPLTGVLIAGCFFMSLVSFIFDFRVAIAEIFALGVIVAVAFAQKELEEKKLHSIVKRLEKRISAESESGLETFPLPIIIFDNTEKVIWYNNIFKRKFLDGKQQMGIDVKNFTSNQGLDIIRENSFIDCEFGKRKFTAFSEKLDYKNETAYSLYFIENTELKNFKSKFLESRPVVMLISIDGAEDSLREYRESQVAEISGGVETIIENWFSSYGCIVKKLGSGRFIIIADAKSLNAMRENKFSVLSLIRSYTYKDRVLELSLSIGAGMEDTFTECENSAKQALDMALGRGGDQVAIKGRNSDYEFFGGVSNGVEKHTKVKARRVASAISQTIKNSSNVLIMGHRFADLDALGASVGMAMICNALEKDAKIVMSLKNSLAMPLVNHLALKGMDEIIIEPQKAEEYLNAKTLLIIVDTHRKMFLEYPELYDLVDSVAVIDHHRKTVDHINKAVIFYHEPHASSASEMVTELIEYISVKVNVPPVCAEALMSGITLDTKNFVMNTGVRTFEAAAFLRSRGANTVAVKQLFSNSMKTQKDKSEAVKSAAIYKNCAISVVDFEAENVRIVASQAADELLNIDSISASFVLFKTENTVNISARSYGEMNVQLAMESLGGGGHKTMAAAQLENETFENTLDRLKNVIDNLIQE